MSLRRLSAIAALVLVAGAPTLAGCGDSEPGPAARAGASANPTPTAAPTRGYPSSIAVLGHSGSTGENSDPDRPGVEVRENSWVTGTNPAVNSVYLRILERNPAIEGHNLGYSEAGAGIDQVAAQADRLLENDPDTDLILIQVMDNDLTCPLDSAALADFQAKLTAMLGKLGRDAPSSSQFVVSQFGSVPTTVEALSRAERAAFGGTGPCDFTTPTGQVVWEKVARLEKAIHVYEAALQAACETVRQCTYDDGAFGRIVDRREYLSSDLNHLSIEGHAKAARVAWAALERAGIVGPATRAATSTFPGENGPIAFRQFDPGTAGDPAPLFGAAADGTGVRKLNGRPGFFSDWRADGRRLVFDFFEPDGDEQIATIKPDGTDVEVITRGPGIHEVLSWSPNGRRIVFDYSPDHPNAPGFETRLWTMRADGSNARPLPMRSPGFDVEPRYSPDGRLIAFARLRFAKGGEQRQAVFTVATKSRPVRRLTPWQLSAEHPTWSPDGRLVAFSTPAGDIQVVRPNATARKTIAPASDGFGAHKPWFSPDGTRILFMCENRGTSPEPPAHYNEDLCIMNADGTNITKVIDTPHTLENWPSWGPAPSGRDLG